MELIPAFYFNPRELVEIADRHRGTFSEAKPFPHVVVDDFLPEPVLDRLVQEFPGPDDIDWTVWGPGFGPHSEDKHREKIGSSHEWRWGPFTRHFMAQLYSSIFIRFVEYMTGFEGLVPDPAYRGCGLHSTGRGGRLMIHADPSRHPNAQLDQILNLIIYLNHDWDDDYGGHFELWDETGDNCVKKIAPIANRAVLFYTSDKSFHGHPRPLNCPPDRRRNSLAVYYYQVGREQTEDYDGQRAYGIWRPAAGKSD